MIITNITICSTQAQYLTNICRKYTSNTPRVSDLLNVCSNPGLFHIKIYMYTCVLLYVIYDMLYMNIYENISLAQLDESDKSSYVHPWYFVCSRFLRL